MDINAKCVYCHSAIGLRKPCPRCNTLLHPDCWETQFNCPTLGCGWNIKEFGLGSPNSEIGNKSKVDLDEAHRFLDRLNRGEVKFPEGKQEGDHISIPLYDFSNFGAYKPTSCFVQGQNVAASPTNSIVLGYSTTVSAPYSFAQGFDANTSGVENNCPKL